MSVCQYCGSRLPHVMALCSLDAALSIGVQWANATFPNSMTEAKIAHLRREVEELAANPADPNEYADILLILAHLANRHGINLVEAVHGKLVILRTRKWGTPDAEGVIEHVREGVQP